MQSEKELLEKRITNPTLYHNSNHLRKSDLKWNSIFSKRDLIELLTALDAISVITKIDGSSMSFVQLVKSVDQFLNVKLPYSHKARENVVARKIKTTGFLSRLKDALIKKSVK